MSIAAMVTGTLVQAVQAGQEFTGRVVLEGDLPVHLLTRRTALGKALLAVPVGMPVSVAGTLTTAVHFDKRERPYVHHTLHVTAVTTPQPAAPARTGLLRDFLKAST